MALSGGWLFLLLGVNLVVGLAVGWTIRTFLPSLAGAAACGEPPDSESLLQSISRETKQCTENLKRFERELSTADKVGAPSNLLDRIQQSHGSYRESLASNVSQFSSIAVQGDAVLRHVLVELIKHTGQVEKFTHTLDERLLNGLPEESRLLLATAITELIASNQHLESELQSARREIEKQREKLIEAQREARIDPLTRLANRRLFEERHLAIHSRFERAHETYAIVMIDLDRFKTLNDTYGHPAGDAALQVFARILEQCIRKYDVAARIGGEEFALILPNSGKKEAMIVSERVRARTASATVRYGTDEITFTCSAGVAMARQEESVDEVMRRADAALYAAKNFGRDRVELSQHDAEPFRAGMVESVSAV